MRQVGDHPAGQSTWQCRDDDLVHLLALGELADRLDRRGLDDLVLRFGARLVQPRQLTSQPSLGQRGGELVGVGDEPLDRPAAPVVVALGLGDGNREEEAAGSGPQALVQLLRELFATECLVGHDEIPAHGSRLPAVVTRV